MPNEIVERYGVVLSCAASTTGNIVTPIPVEHDQYSFVELIESLQPGVVAVPVHDFGYGWRTDNGYTPERVVEMFAADPLLTSAAFEDDRGENPDYYLLNGVIMCLEHDEEIDYRYGCRYCPPEV
jgi:hypothetical protein